MPNMPAAHLPNSECSLFLCHCLREHIKIDLITAVITKYGANNFRMNI